MAVALEEQGGKMEGAQEIKLLIAVQALNTGAAVICEW